MLNLAKERWKLFPQKDKSVHEENALEERGPERSGVSEPDGGSRKEAAGNPDTAGDDSGLDSSLPIGNWARNTNSVPKPIGNRKKEHREDAAVRRAEKSALPTGSTFGGENAEPGSRGGGLGAENGHPPVGKGPETVGKVLEMWYEMERRGAAVDELEGGLEGERSAAKEGLEEEISAAKEGLEGERSAAKEDLEGKRSAAKEGLETGENEAAKTGAGGMSGDAVVDASQGNADPESVAHEQAPSVGMVSRLAFERGEFSYPCHGQISGSKFLSCFFCEP